MAATTLERITAERKAALLSCREDYFFGNGKPHCLAKAGVSYTKHTAATVPFFQFVIEPGGTFSAEMPLTRASTATKHRTCKT